MSEPIAINGVNVSPYTFPSTEWSLAIRRLHDAVSALADASVYSHIGGNDHVAESARIEEALQHINDARGHIAKGRGLMMWRDVP